MTNRAVVFVTGGTGFVGRHIVEALDQNYSVRVLLRKPPAVPLPPGVEQVIGDLHAPATYAPALSGVSAVVHAALTDHAAKDVESTLALHRLSAQEGVRKFVHLSSVAIYGNHKAGTISERTAPEASSDYSRLKLAIEDALISAPPVPELLILRLACVYGPGKGWWSHSLLGMMESGAVILVDGGSGIANLIHVGDAAGIVLLVLERSNAASEVFNVTDGIPVSWRDYFTGLEKILGRPATVSMTAEEARGYGRNWMRPSLLRRGLRKLTGGKQIHPLGDSDIEWFQSRAVFSNQKASSELGFSPQYDLERGMETVGEYRRRLLRSS